MPKFNINDVVITCILFLFLFLHAELIEAKKGLVVNSSTIARILEESATTVSYNSSLFQQPQSYSTINNARVQEVGSFHFDLTDNNLIPTSSIKKPEAIRLSGNVKQITDDETLQRYLLEIGDMSRIVINVQYMGQNNRIRAGIQYTNNKDYLTSSFSIQHQINDLLSVHSQFTHANEAKLASFGAGFKPLPNLTLTGEVGTDLSEVTEIEKIGFVARYRF